MHSVARELSLAMFNMGYTSMKLNFSNSRANEEKGYTQQTVETRCRNI